MSGGGAWAWYSHRTDDIVGSLTVGVGSSILAAAIVAFLSPVNEAGFRKFISLGIDDVWSSRRAIDDRDWVDWMNRATNRCVLLGIAHGNWCTDKRFGFALKDRLEEGVEFQILFLDPKSTFAEDRGKEDKGKQDTRDRIRESIHFMWNIRQKLDPGIRPRLELYIYEGTPSCGLTWVMGRDEFMVVTHYLARVPNPDCPAFTVRRPEGGTKPCLYDIYAENLDKIIKEAGTRLDDENIEDFLPQKTEGDKSANLNEQKPNAIPQGPADGGV